MPSTADAPMLLIAVAAFLLLGVVPVGAVRTLGDEAASTPPLRQRIGRFLRLRLGLVPGGATQERLWGTSAIMMSLVIVHPAAPVLGLLGLWGRHVADVRHSRLEKEHLGWLAAPETAGVMALAVRSGANVYRAIDVVAARVPGFGGATFGEVSRQLGMGVLLDQAIEEISVELGVAGQPIVRVIRRCTSTGAALAPALERVAGELRSQQHQRQLEAARRLPVLLLFPLVTCTLPAFALLTVVPLLVTSLGQLSG